MWTREILNKMNIERIIFTSQRIKTESTVLKKMKNSIIIYADNQRAIKLVNNSIFQKRIKHIAIKYHYTRDLISKKIIKLKYRSTSEMIADELTKSLDPRQFKRFVKQLDMTKSESMNWSIRDNH
jgi:transposase-like protein